MTPKEKAVDLLNNYVMLVGSDWNGLAKARKCAIIAVNEILNIDFLIPIHGNRNATHEYWQQVKEEIQLP